MIRNQTHRSCRLVLIPLPYQGHITPILQLATILHLKGFSITIAHAIFNSPNSQNYPEFTFLPLQDGLTDSLISSGDLPTIVLTLNKNCKVSFKKCLTQLMETQQEDENITCIISDELMFFSESVASDLNLPRIILRTTSATTCLARTAVATLKAQGYLPFQESVSSDLIPELQTLRFKDLPLIAEVDLEEYVKVVVNAYNTGSSSAIIWNTMDFLEHSSLAQVQKIFQVPIFPIGPIHKIAPTTCSSLHQEDRNSIKWLDKQHNNSVIYVSLGSIVSINDKEFAEMAWGLANSHQSFLWVIRPDSIRGFDWMELLPPSLINVVNERGFIVKWAPQKEVLAHKAVGGFLSHCGWNSTLESICEGVPLICRPGFGDQRVNTRYVCYVWRIGLELENKLIERGEIERAVRRLILDDEGKEMTGRAKELKEKVAVSISRDGSSNNSLNKLVALIMSFSLQ